MMLHVVVVVCLDSSVVVSGIVNDCCCCCCCTTHSRIAMPMRYYPPVIWQAIMTDGAPVSAADSGHNAVAAVVDA